MMPYNSVEIIRTFLTEVCRKGVVLEIRSELNAST